MNRDATQPSCAAMLILKLVRLRAQRLAMWQQLLWQSGNASPDQGLAITAAEVARLLHPEEVAAQEASLYIQDESAVALGAAIATTEAALAADEGWSKFRDGFALDSAESDFLALMIAVELDPGLQRVLAYLHDDSRQSHPTAHLSERLAGRTIPSPFAGTALLRWRLAAPLDGAPPQRLTTAWRVDPAVVLSVFAGSWRDPSIADVVTLVVAGALCLHSDARRALQDAADLCEIELVGPDGIGRQTVAAQFAASIGRPLLSADFPALIELGHTAADAVTLVLRQARSIGALAYFRDADTVPAPQWVQARKLGVPFLRGARQATGAPRSISMAPLPTARRIAVWQSLSDLPPPAMLLTHRLTPAEIARAAASPGTFDWSHGMRPLESGLLSRLSCPYRWDDLVLPADLLRQLHEFEDQVRLRWPVYEDWGFARLTHLGSGIAALFSGPSGTGKTMAAQVLARELGLDLYRVDLAGVVNKYIGETEKRLRDVFDLCDHSGALLFFDEADALFGTRIQAKDAHDRFANIEIDYLLQRIERFDGVAILATNRRGDLDSAFLRRLRFIVEFLAPRPEERLILWRHALARPAPNGEVILDPVDWEMLAQRLQMTGAEIKSTALAAAFLAKAEGGRIGMRHILAAAQREMAKHGAKLRVPLQEVTSA